MFNYLKYFLINAHSTLKCKFNFLTTFDIRVTTCYLEQYETEYESWFGVEISQTASAMLSKRTIEKRINLMVKTLVSSAINSTVRTV